MRISVSFFIFVFFQFWTSIGYSCDVIDDVNQKISLNHPASRVVSLAPDLTEILFAIGSGNKVVGVMKGSDYPADAKKIPVVANYLEVNKEAILLLHPDLIVAWDQGNMREQLAFFKQFHIPVYLTRPVNIADVPHTMRNLGCLTGESVAADSLAEDFQQRYEKLKKTYSRRKKVTVFYEVWNKPLMTIGKTSWINQIITLCSGTNIFANVKGAAPTINPEAVLQANPDVIIANDTTWQAWPTLRAVRLKHIYPISPDLLERAGPRLIEGATQLCQLIHKE